jgi:small subunit ribosomal protein S13
MYLLGKFLKDDMIVYIGLKKIFGVGPLLSERLCVYAGINKKSKIGDLSLSQVAKFYLLLESLSSLKNEKRSLIEDDLKGFVNSSILNLVSINNFRGSRHVKALPCRGQRTKTNSRTARKIRRKI